MCGICGIVNFDKKPVNESDIQLMMRKIKHRGPDDEGLFIDGSIGLGFVRLSIIDLSPLGHQPMFDSSGRYVLIYNGEVYNYIEIRDELKKLGYIFKSNSDSEVLLYSYIEWGEKCLDKFNGMWAFAIFDTFTHKIFLARDRYGIKPLYYFKNNNIFIFASEVRAILPLITERKVNESAIYDYLIYNRTDQSNQTFFHNILKIPHGCYALITEDNFIIKRWYELNSRLREPFSDPYEYYDSFKNSLKLRLRSDVPVGVCLSGGIDSSSIVSVLLKEFNKNDLNTFSAIYSHGEKADESKYINEYRHKLLNMYFTTPTAETLYKDLNNFISCHFEPVSNLGPYAQFKVMELVSQTDVVVTMDGQGADEQFAGYDYFYGSFFKELLAKIKIIDFIKEVSSYIKVYNSAYAFKYLLLYLAPRNIKNNFGRLAHNYVQDDFFKLYSCKSDVALNLYNPSTLGDSLLQHFEYKLEHLLKWEDQNSMWFSIESRVPYLDFNLVERTLGIPSEKIIKGSVRKFFLREVMKDVLPEKIKNRFDKIGFETPNDKWFRTKLFQEYIFDILNSQSFKNRGYLNAKVCLRDYQRHVVGEINISKEIWKWINLELWYRIFID